MIVICVHWSTKQLRSIICGLFSMSTISSIKPKICHNCHWIYIGMQSVKLFKKSVALLWFNWKNIVSILFEITCSKILLGYNRVKPSISPFFLYIISTNIPLPYSRFTVYIFRAVGTKAKGQGIILTSSDFGWNKVQ